MRDRDAANLVPALCFPYSPMGGRSASSTFLIQFYTAARRVSDCRNNSSVLSSSAAMPITRWHRGHLRRWLWGNPFICGSSASYTSVQFLSRGVSNAPRIFLQTGHRKDGRRSRVRFKPLGVSRTMHSLLLSKTNPASSLALDELMHNTDRHPLDVQLTH